MSAVTAYVGLGSNLGQPEAQLRAAWQALRALPATGHHRCSAFYRSPPWDGSDQPDYLNAVAGFDTTLTPDALLDALQAIERAQGRQRDAGNRYAPRTLDLDLLLYGDQRLDTPRLQLPHYAMAERDFVLIPLAELAPQLCLPDGRCIADLVAALPGTNLQRLDD